jgi:hypothetical protein
MSETMAVTPARRAEDDLRAALETQRRGAPAVVLSSPPGGGKTGLVERLALQEMAILGGRAMLVTETNQQAFDLARRLAADFPRHGVVLFLSDAARPPADLLETASVRVVRKGAELPRGPCVVVANAKRWAHATALDRFSLQVVDEAFQLADAEFVQIAGLADRVMLVGDPGQIAPFARGDIDRWRGDPAGPHVACPRALLARHPNMPRRALSVSRRLVPDTVAIVRPAFYPDLPFDALGAAGERGLRVGRPGSGPLDRAIDRAVDGMSLVQVELPPRATGEVDEGVADAIAGVVDRLLARDVRVLDDGVMRPLTPAMVGVACAHVAQVNAVAERLPEAYADVLVETGNRFQGLERPVMVVHHPLSGRADGDAFHLDAGRLCVMLSRHRVACLVVTRGGVEEMLDRYAPRGERVLGIDEDAEFAGWTAQVQVAAMMRDQGRVVRMA